MSVVKGSGITLPLGSRFGAKRSKRLQRVLRPVRWGNLRRLEPRSSRFGFDRGTPIDRHYLDRFVRRHSGCIRGIVGEVAEPTYADLGGAAVSTVEILDIDPANPRVTMLVDLADEHALPRRHFDCLIVTQTLQYIGEPEAALRGLARALKPGGILILAVPALAPHDSIEDDDSDYWRFWPAGLHKLLARTVPGAALTVQGYGNLLTATAFLQGISAEELYAEELEAHDPRYPIVVCALAEISSVSGVRA